MFARLRSTFSVAALAVVALASAAGAQQPASEAAPQDIAVQEVAPTVEAVSSVAAIPAGPVMDAAMITVRADRGEALGLEETAAAVLQQRRNQRSTTLMLVGGAAFLAGLLIGDDAGTAVALGGAIVGLYGLYLYLQ